jgi:hypothetical protein
MKGKTSQERGNGRPKLRINKEAGKARIFISMAMHALTFQKATTHHRENVASGIQIGPLANSPLQ